jgi:hypothetical protein
MAYCKLQMECGKTSLLPQAVGGRSVGKGSRYNVKVNLNSNLLISGKS